MYVNVLPEKLIMCFMALDGQYPNHVKETDQNRRGFHPASFSI